MSTSTLTAAPQTAEEHLQGSVAAFLAARPVLSEALRDHIVVALSPAA